MEGYLYASRENLSILNGLDDSETMEVSWGSQILKNLEFRWGIKDINFRNRLGGIKLPNRLIRFFNANHNPNSNAIERHRKFKKSSPEVIQSPKTDPDSGGSTWIRFVTQVCFVDGSVASND
jgi:hypothetical protein